MLVFASSYVKFPLTPPSAHVLHLSIVNLVVNVFVVACCASLLFVLVLTLTLELVLVLTATPCGEHPFRPPPAHVLHPPVVSLNVCILSPFRTPKGSLSLRYLCIPVLVL